MQPLWSAGLNKFEEAAGGEFGMGTAQQYGEADCVGRSFENEDLRRSNFTSANARCASEPASLYSIPVHPELSTLRSCYKSN